jgi:Kdo2-lipid IVA lauroyltransferase/acyltransferase
VIALARVLGALLGWLAGSVLRIRRAHVERAMRAAGVEQPSRQARAMYRALGTSVFEFLWMAARGVAVLDVVTIEPASRARWAQALSEGRGVVVAASHTGNWDLSACAIAREVELLVVTKRLSVRWLDRFWQATRAKLGVRLTEASGAVGRAREVARRGGAVAMMIDQVPLVRHALPVAFLGQSAHADRAPAAMAAAAGAPLVVAVGRREPSGRHLLHVLEVLTPPSRPTRVWIDEATRRATRELERFVLAYPDQWLWMHRRWKPMLAAPCKTGRTPSSSRAEASRAA